MFFNRDFQNSKYKNNGVPGIGDIGIVFYLLPNLVHIRVRSGEPKLAHYKSTFIFFYNREVRGSATLYPRELLHG